MKTIQRIVTTIAVTTRGMRATVAAIALFTVLMPPAAAVDTLPPAVSPTTFVGGVRVQDELAVVNVRNLCGVWDASAIRTGIRFETYARRDAIGFRQWQPSDLASFVSFDPSVRTIIFVHGNQITPADAKCEGLEVYRRLIHCDPSSGPIRFVILSWPSAKVPGLLRDFREKAARTGPAGVQLAWLLDQMPAETPVSLIGFSYGARIITGGLHIFAGGSLGAMGLSERVHPSRSPMSIVLMAAAMNAEWLGEGRYHGLALSQVDRALLLNSCNDPAMQYYDLLVPGRGGPQALGLRGPTCLTAEQAAKIRQRNTGSRHDLYLYLCAPGATCQAWEYLAGTVAAPSLSQ